MESHCANMVTASLARRFSQNISITEGQKKIIMIDVCVSLHRGTVNNVSPRDNRISCH